MTSPNKVAIAEAKEALWRKDVKFALANDGMHFMILHHAKRIDFWPTSGAWIARGYKDVRGRGISELLNYLEKEN